MSRIISLIIIASVIAYIFYFLDYTKEYPQCRFSSDFVTCVAIGKIADGKE